MDRMGRIGRTTCQQAFPSRLSSLSSLSFLVSVRQAEAAVVAPHRRLDDAGAVAVAATDEWQLQMTGMRRERGPVLAWTQRDGMVRTRRMPRDATTGAGSRARRQRFRANARL